MHSQIHPSELCDATRRLYDPISDSDGSGQCYLTHNQFGNTDVDFGAVRLRSPFFDMSAGNINISYDYYLYLTNADGVDRILVEIRDTTGPPGWTEIASHTSSGDLSWRSHQITQADLDAAGVVLSNAMRLRFTVNDEPFLLALFEPAQYAVQFPDCDINLADINGDGQIDAFDIEPFLNILFP